MCILRNMIHSPSWYLFIHYDVIKWKVFRFTVLLCGETTCQSGFSSQRDSNADLWCFCCQSEQTVEQTLDWPVFRDAMTVIWRRRNVLNWIVGTVVADGPTPIWHQDILNRHGEIGQCHIYRYANLFQSCPVASGALRKTVTLFNARELRNLWNHAFCKGVRWL